MFCLLWVGAVFVLYMRTLGGEHVEEVRLPFLVEPQGQVHGLAVGGDRIAEGTYDAAAPLRRRRARSPRPAGRSTRSVDT